jgi:hypothetical protein
MTLTIESLRIGSRDSSVSTATRLRVGRPRNRGSIPGRDKRFSLLYNIKTGFGVHPTSCAMGTGADSAGVKRPGCEADHSPPPRAEFKNSGAITPIPHTSSWSSAYLIKPKG